MRLLYSSTSISSLGKYWGGGFFSDGWITRIKTCYCDEIRESSAVKGRSYYLLVYSGR